jgi:hypothetical protein
MMMIPLLFAATLAAAKPAPSAAPTSATALDQKRIHATYNDGNFDSVLRDIESFQKTHPTYSSSDSIFIAKHLAVVYSANPATREKGKYYMFRLLEMLPSAKLIDMYVSDEIDRIFDKVREEYMARQENFGVDTTRLTPPDRAPVNQPKQDALAAQQQPKPVAVTTGAAAEKSNKTVWIAAGVGAVTVGLAAVYYLATSGSSAEDKTYDVP